MLSLLIHIGLIEVIDDCSWMHQDSPQGLRMMDYCNGVLGFINYIISNPRNISGGSIRCSYKRYKNKKFLDPDVVMMYLHRGIFVLVYIRRTICSLRDHARKDGWVNF